MPTDHIVRAGDCMASIAFEHGFLWETLWNHPKNSALKQSRKDPNVLKPGDVVHIPDPAPHDESAGTETRHRFRRKGGPAILKLKLTRPPEPQGTAAASAPPAGASRSVSTEDPEPPAAQADQPWANAPYNLELDGKLSSGTSDGDGIIEVKIPPNARSGTLTIEPGTPRETHIPLNLGHLDPIEDVSGIKQRLVNLGFDCGSSDDTETPGFKAALAAFQEHAGLEATGKVDQRTRDKLKEIHGV
jgi:N-acetylmuramoyl-L-alanine amidase